MWTTRHKGGRGSAARSRISSNSQTRAATHSRMDRIAVRIREALPLIRRLCHRPLSSFVAQQTPRTLAHSSRPAARVATT